MNEQKSLIMHTAEWWENRKNHYQGRLADDAGNPQTGTLGMSFAIWDATNGGTIIWGPESHSAVPVTDGLFNVGLGSQTSGGIPTTTWNGDRYLEITVSGETLTPRELIRSVPIAGMALTVPDGAIETSHIADGSITKPKLAQDITFVQLQGARPLTALLRRFIFRRVIRWRRTPSWCRLGMWMRDRKRSLMNYLLAVWRETAVYPRRVKSCRANTKALHYCNAFCYTMKNSV